MIGAVGVKVSVLPNIAAYAQGRVAVAYYGSTQTDAIGDGYSVSDGRPYDAYLTVSSDPLSDARGASRDA